jgi:hypothetical protein
MPLEVTAKCDLCGAERKECNHWFLGRVGGRHRCALVLLSYTSKEAAKGGSILCGEVCLHKWIGQNLAQIVLPKNSEQPSNFSLDKASAVE